MKQISSDDLHFLAQLPLLKYVSGLVPQSDWGRACYRVLKFADVLRPAPEPANLEHLADISGFDPERLRTAIKASRVGRLENLVQCLHAAKHPNWHPPYHVEGKQKLLDAVERGSGAVLWVTHFCFSSLITKMAMALDDFEVHHISRPEHGVSKSRFGIRFLNRVRVVPEDQYLAGRIVHANQHPGRSMKNAISVLKSNGMVSVTVGAWEGNNLIDCELMNGQYRVASGAPSLSYSTGAALLPIVTVRDGEGKFRVQIGERLDDLSIKGRKEFNLKASEALMRFQEEEIRNSPDQWRGWKDWAKLTNANGVTN